MAKFLRIRNPEYLPLVRSMLVADPDESKDADVEQLLKQVMEREPDAVYFAIAYNQSVNDPPTAFAFVLDVREANYVMLLQAYSSPGTSKTVTLRLLAMAMGWASSIGKTVLRAETKHDTDALFRLWGFRHVKSIVEINADEMYDRLLGKEEISNGQRDENIKRIEHTTENSP